MLLSCSLILCLTLIGLACIIHPPSASKVAMLALKALLMLIVAQMLLGYLWGNWIGRLLLVASVIAAIWGRKNKE